MYSIEIFIVHFFMLKFINHFFGEESTEYSEKVIYIHVSLVHPSSGFLYHTRRSGRCVL